MDVKKNVLIAAVEEENQDQNQEDDDDDGMQAREYRKGHWTLNETMVLIQAKKMDYERRAQRVKEGSSSSSVMRPHEMMIVRWKWVEDWCWGHGCSRSQNQCNDRWDNLMRDYNKVRAYQMSSIVEQNPSSSYWKLERHERKDKNLPSNLLPEIYQALSEAVRMKAAAASGIARPVEEDRHRLMQHQSPVPEPPQSICTAPPLPPHPPPSTASEDRQQQPMSPERKRKRGRGSSRGRSNRHELSSAISKCASIIAEALQAGEHKEGMRHKDFITIEQRKAKLEESKSEMRIQSMEGLATAINKLASSILGLVTDRVQKLQK